MLRFLHICLVLITLAAYLPPLINPEYFWPIATLGLIAPLLWFCVLIFALYWLFKKDKAIYLSLITLLLGWEMISNAFAFPDQEVNTASTPVRIVSLNGHGFRAKAPLQEEDIPVFLAELNADLILLQEFQMRGAGQELAQRVKTLTGLPYEFRQAEGQLVVFSRYPLKNGKIEYFTNRVNAYLTVDVETPTGTWKVINAHLQTNAISNLAYEVTKDGKLQEKKTWQKIKTMFGRYARSNKIRTQQAQKILRAVENSAHSVILAGDFNDVPTSYLYHSFRDQLEDAHLAQSWGLGTTYKGLLPGLRIDYILPDAELEVHDFDRIPCPFSDHQAIRAEISGQND